MRLLDMLGPQRRARRKSRVETVPEVFIIESLDLADERNARREGEVLAAVLRMCGKQPLYYYIRTRAELELMAQLFYDSNYRYLHISCHGGKSSLSTTLDGIDYEEFATIFAGRLKNRRLFVSACSAGNAKFAKLVRNQNKGVISVAAPAKDIQFDHAVAFWSSFYVKTFSTNSRSMSSDRIAAVLRPLANLFGEPVHLSRKDKAGKWIHGVIGG
jgi:hypothetical protein